MTALHKEPEKEQLSNAFPPPFHSSIPHLPGAREPAGVMITQK